jgi:predicted nucleic-acid-binding Zn-ribbon protein
MKDGKCRNCGSREVMTDLEVRDDGRNGSHPLRVVIEEPEPPKHGRIWLQGQSTGDVSAWICPKCGYTELYTNNLEALYESYKKSNR